MTTETKDVEFVMKIALDKDVLPKISGGKIPHHESMRRAVISPDNTFYRAGDVGFIAFHDTSTATADLHLAFLKSVWGTGIPRNAVGDAIYKLWRDHAGVQKIKGMFFSNRADVRKLLKALGFHLSNNVSVPEDMEEWVQMRGAN